MRKTRWVRRKKIIIKHNRIIEKNEIENKIKIRARKKRKMSGAFSQFFVIDVAVFQRQVSNFV